MNKEVYIKYLNSICKIPRFLNKYLEVPCLVRLKNIGYFCGMDYASKNIYNFSEYISRYDHSLTTALLTYKLTKNKTKTLASLFHDIATPCFSHVIDYMNKDYENAFSQPTVSEENTLGYTFISGSGITNKQNGQEYADRLFSATLGVNMSTDLDLIEVQGTFGGSVRIIIYIITSVMILACIAIAYVLFRKLGIVSSLSFVFALMISVVISAFCDLQITFAGWLGFMFGIILNFILHMYYLKCIKREYAKGKKFLVSFTSGYKSALFNMLDILLVITGVCLVMLIVPSSAIRMFVFNYLITLAGTAFTALYLNKVLAVNYTAFNLKNEKKINFTRGEMIDEVE